MLRDCGHVVIASPKGPSRPHIGITTDIRDIPLRIKLQQTIGGKVREFKGLNAVRLDITTLDDVAKFISLVNGSFKNT
jgi:hypothetical protein